MSACVTCGEDNPQHARFCWSCGRALEPAPPAGAGETRKTVTVLFCDVKGSTGLGEQLDPESQRRLMGRFFDEMRSVVERNGGVVEKFIGDAVMAVFGIPTVHEDDARRAVGAALGMQEALRRLNASVTPAYGVELAMRTGVNTGEVVTGDASPAQTLVTGDAVVVAKRLEEVAQPGQILVGERTERLVRDVVELEAVGPVALKGKSAPLPAWRVVAPRDVVGPLRLDSPLVGRHLELAALEETFELAVAERSCRLFTVFGPAGIGKSRLTHEFCEWLGDRGRVLRGRCLSYGEGITFWPLVEIVKDAAGVVDGDDLESARRKIARLLPESDDAGIVCERIAATAGRGEVNGRSEETFWAVRKLLEALANERPVVVVLEDIHWAEDTFLDLVEYLAGWSRDHPILLLCLARPDLVEGRPSWAIPRANATAISLDPLIENESDRLIRNLLGDAGLADDVRVRIASAAAGNPLFVEEMLRMLIDDGLVSRENGSWMTSGDMSRVQIPPTIQALVASRLDRLPADERRVLQAAAVVGEVFWWGAVAEVLPDLRGSVGTHLQALVRKELVRHERSKVEREDAFRFSHVLIRDAAYNALPKALRGDLHERLAGWIERKTAHTGEYEELMGYHLEQAYRYRAELGALDLHSEELATRASERLASAGRRAAARGDMPAAAKLLERAAGLLPPFAAERLELLAPLGAALAATGDLARADTILSEAVERAVAIGNGRVEAHALVERAAQRLYTDPEGQTSELLRLARELVPVFRELDDELGLAKTWLLLAQVYWMRGRFGDMERVLERALVHAEQAGAEHEVAAILGDIARVLVVGPTPVESGIRRCQQILAHATRDRELEAVVSAMVAALEAMRGDFEEGRRLYGRGKAILAELGLTVPLARLPLYSSVVETLAGDAAAAERDLRAGYETFVAMGEKGRLSTTAAFLAAAMYELGRHEEAERFTHVSEEAASRDDFVSQVIWRSVRAKVQALGDEVPAALALAREAVAMADETDYLTMRGDAYVSLAEVLLQADAFDEAADALAEAQRLHAAKGNVVSAERAKTLLAGLAVRARA